MPNAPTDNACSYTIPITLNSKNQREERNEREGEQKRIKEIDGRRLRGRRKKKTVRERRRGGREEQVLYTGKRDEGAVGKRRKLV